MSNTTHTTRREFLKTAGAAVAAPYVITTTALGADGRPPASERIVMGGIGIGNMGVDGDQGRLFLDRADVQYVAVCDVKEAARDAARDKVNKHYANTDCKVYNDFRELLARKDIDAVHIATPDHWHAIIVIEACRHGKDVYCQKPETRTLREGPLMVAAARRYGRVVSGGSQRVLEDYRDSGRQVLGRRAGHDQVDQRPWVRCRSRAICRRQPVPAGIDWDMWLGPAPWAPYHPTASPAPTVTAETVGDRGATIPAAA